MNIKLVIGFGGFASGPGGIAAVITKTKLVLHEQNAVPGMTNKVLAKFATLICEAFPNAFQSRRKVVVTGNPIRQAIVDQTTKEIQQEGARTINLLIIGGSRGAQIFNQKLPEIFADFKQTSSLSVLHQTGAGNLKSVIQLYQQRKVEVDYQVKEFIHDMAAAYQWANLVICRAGALTVSEVAAMGLPAIFVPYPFAVDDHQTKNAKFLADEAAAIIVKQNEIQQILVYLNRWANNSPELIAMSKRAKQQAVLNATTTICNHCEDLIEREAA